VTTSFLSPLPPLSLLLTRLPTPARFTLIPMLSPLSLLLTVSRRLLLTVLPT